MKKSPKGRKQTIKDKLLSFLTIINPYRLIILLAIFLFVISLIFLSGYVLGLNDSKISNTYIPDTMPSITPVQFVANFQVTPVPPDESGWTSYNNVKTHYHLLSFKLPSAYGQTQSDSGRYTYTDGNGNSITFSPSSPSSYQKVTKVNYETDNFRGHVDETNAKGSKIEEFTIDLLDENLVVTFTGPDTNYFAANDMLKTMSVSFLAPEYPIVTKSITTGIANILYPSSYIADTLLQDTKNCNNSPESIINLKILDYVIEIDINKCMDTKTHPIIKAVKQTVNAKDYIRVEYADHSYCYIAADTHSIKDLILYPLNKWTFAPKDTNLDGYNSRICINGDLSKTGIKNQETILSDFNYILGHMSTYPIQ